MRLPRKTRWGRAGRVVEERPGKGTKRNWRGGEYNGCGQRRQPRMEASVSIINGGSFRKNRAEQSWEVEARR